MLPVDSGIIALLFLSTVGQMASAIFVPSLPLIAEELNLLPFIIQRLASVYLLAYAFAHMVGGFFVIGLAEDRSYYGAFLPRL